MNNASFINPAQKYRPEIDGLRCLAVMVVIFYHAGFSMFSGGYVGVDVFFVISGYLITGIIYKELKEGRFSFLTFYERRARRIFPALFFVIFCCIPLAWITLTPEQLKNFSQSVASIIVFLSNFYFWNKSGYFDQNSEELPLLHTWSLSVEEQFYIFFPILLLILWKFRPSKIGFAVSILMLTSLILCIGLEWSDPNKNFFWPHTRAWELLVGSLIALNQERINNHYERLGILYQILSGIGVILILLPVVMLNEHSSFPGLSAIVPVLGTALIIVFAKQGTIIARLFAIKPFVFIGLISYSAYLWHQPIFAFSRIILDNQISDFIYSALITLSLILAYLTWKFVEAPFRNKKRISRKQIFIFSATVMPAFLVIGIVGHMKKGFPERFPAEVLQVADTAKASPYREICHTESVEYLRPKDSCSHFDGVPTWVVFGDSHGVELSYAIAEKLKGSNQSVRLLSFSGCLPAYSFVSSNPGCTNWTREAIDFITSNEKLENIIILYRHSFYLYGDHAPNYPNIPNEEPLHMEGIDLEVKRKLYFDSFESIIQILTSAGKNVFVMEPIPELPESIDREIFKAGNLKAEEGNIFGSTQGYYQKRHSKILEKIGQLDSKYNIHVIKPTKKLCPSGKCIAIQNGKALYFDDNHLSVSGADLVADLIFNDI